MGLESVTRVSSSPSFRSSLKTGVQPDDEQQSEVEANQQKFIDEQKKAAEEFKRKQEQKQKEKEQEQELDMLRKQLEASQKEAEAMEDQFEAFAKCLKIASRVSRGDIVPAKDLKYLAEHEPDLYKQAILLRMPNPKPKKHKSVVGDEDEESQETQGSESASGSEGSDGDVSAEAAEGSSGSGGEAAAE